MAIYTVAIKTHSREDITAQFDNLNECIVHGCKPTILKIVSGKRKYVDFVAVCKDDNCSKISESVEKTVAAWNKWNPISTHKE